MVIFGISTSASPIRFYWNWLKNVDFEAVEINLAKSEFPFSENSIKRFVKPTITKFNTSLHTRSDPLFGGNKILNESNRRVLFAEIEIAKILNVNQIVFHLPKIKEFSSIKKEVLNYLPKIIEFAKNRNVQLLLENSSRASFSKPENLLFIFDKFPELKLALDTGHVFRAEKDGVDRFDFLKQLKKYAVYSHVHDSKLPGDKHQALVDKPINKEFFNELKKSNIQKYIMEAHTYEGCLQTRTLLKTYGFH